MKNQHKKLHNFLVLHALNTLLPHSAHLSAALSLCITKIKERQSPFCLNTIRPMISC